MRWPDLSSALGARVRLRAATQPLSVRRLSPGEQVIFDRLRGDRRRHDWLLGRTALRPLLDGADTSTVAFPHPQLSLTHAAGLAVAAACDGPQAGLGVDFEGWRPTDPRTARFFLHDDERAVAGGASHGLLRLWTVKEALFKATPVNAGAQLLDYRLADPSSVAGTATDVRGHTFRYVSGSLPAGPLAVAICLGRASAPV